VYPDTTVYRVEHTGVVRKCRNLAAGR
jgi:hypothetical protein